MVTNAKPIVFFVLFSIHFFLASTSFAQQLKRSGMLGIHPAPISVKEALDIGLSGTNGVKVTTVLPNSTADKMMLKVGDILLQVNEHELNGLKSLYAVLKKYHEGDELEILLWREGEEKKCKGVMKARPIAPLPSGKQSLDEVPFRDGFLRAFWAKPEGKGPFPTIYFLQGYPCQSVDYNMSWNPMGRLVGQLVERGYAVFRVEKPGVGESSGAMDCMGIDFSTELSAFEAGYAHLLDQSIVDTSQLFLYGHSLGGIVAPLLAAKHQPKGVMVYGTGVYNWEDYMIELFRTQYPVFGRDYAEVEKSLALLRPLFYQYFHEGKAPKDLEGSEAAKRVFMDLMGCEDQVHCINRHYSFWQSLNSFNLVEAWSQYKGKVLTLYGEFDLEALNSKAAEKIVEITNHYHPGNGTFKFIPNTEHGLLKVNSMEQKVQLVTGQIKMGPYAKENYNDTYVDILDQWMQKIIN